MHSGDMVITEEVFVKTKLKIAAYASLSIMLASNASAMTEEEYNAKIGEINNKFQSSYDDAKAKGDDIKKESETCLIEAAFDADWELTKVSFDVPEVSFKNREMSFHTVKTKFINKVIARTKVPKTYFENKCVVSAFGKCRVKTKVPVIKWEIDEIKTKVPEFSWDKTSFSAKIPEFRSKRIEWKFHILKIKKLRDLSLPCKEEEERAEALSQSVENVASEHQKEINYTTAEYLGSIASELADQMEVAVREFDAGIASMDSSIAEMRANGIDPSQFQIDYDGRQTTMTAARDALVKERATALADMEASHRSILHQIEALTRI